MKRRELIVLGVAAAAWPLATRAQQPRKDVRIGYLGAQPNNPMIAESYSVLSSELRQFGFVEGRNLTIEYRYHGVGADPAAQAAELVRSNVDLLVADGPEAALQAAVGASRTTPIVRCAINFDPIARGYVSSLARPGGNVTGIFFQPLELAQKQLELLAEALPGKTKAEAIYDALSLDQFTAAKRAAGNMTVELRGLELENPPYDFDAAFRVMAQGSPQMLLVLSSAHFTNSRSRIATLAIEQRLPTMFTFKTYVEAGGLMSYGVDYIDMHRRIAAFVAKILDGVKPADIPVEQPTKFELVVNLKTAKVIGIELPTSILLRADEVIE
jgi:putative tryptophan/tyrosine transport system substrate-binding protein